MPTLWEMLTKKKEEEKTPVELQFYNPAKARVGNHVKIRTIEYEDLDFHITAIREVKRTIGDQTFYFSDYDIMARPFDGDPVRKRLRMTPMENADAELTHDVVLLDLLDEFGYHEEFHHGLSYENNQGEFSEGDKMFYRVNDVTTEWNADCAFLSDEDQSGEVDEDEVRRRQVTYWDFWREEPNASGDPVLEFMLVEMDKDNGFFQLYMGKQVDAARVEIS